MPQNPGRRDDFEALGLAQRDAARVGKNTHVQNLTFFRARATNLFCESNGQRTRHLPLAKLSLGTGVVCGVVVGPRATTAISKGKGEFDVA